MELDTKAAQFMEWEKHVRGKAEWEQEIENTRAFKYMDDTPSPQPEQVKHPQFMVLTLMLNIVRINRGSSVGN